MMEEEEEIPLLTSGSGFKIVHQVWAAGESEDEAHDASADISLVRASSIKSTLSHVPEFECSEPLSQILSQESEPGEGRKKITRIEAYRLLQEAKSATDAAQSALELICGDDFNEASGEDLEIRDNLVSRVRKNLGKLDRDTKKRGRGLCKVRDPDKTFLSTSTCADFGLISSKSEGVEGSKNEKAIQTDDISKACNGTQTEGSQHRPFRKPFAELKVSHRNQSLTEMSIPCLGCCNSEV